MLSNWFGRKVLAAIDLHGDWETVVEHGLAFAREAGVGLHIAHVMEPAPPLVRRALDTRALREVARRHETESRERLDAAIERYGGDVPVEYSLLKGKAPDEILHLAGSTRAGLVVCGVGRGHGQYEVGSTTEGVVRLSKVPVLVVGAGAPRKFRRILIPTDLDRADVGAIRLASSLAAAHKSRVVAVHVCAVPSLLRGYLGDTAGLRRDIVSKARQDFRAFIADIELPEKGRAVHKVLNATPDTEEAAEAIVVDAERLEIDLIVMAMGGRGFLRWFVLGSTAEKVMRSLPCSLLACPQAWARRR